ncbi:hypothetical protein [Parapedobacter tibetensis]|uniref:hypothetical protein n=1 Tax=Parapedobacter tibetensis TaxID=2972951 RepID=UPI00214DC1F4|nr:hypothetical protein [Parapedobacter tibetensis]
MRISISFLFVLMTIQSCGQNKERVENQTTGKTIREIEKYDNEPVYRLKVTSSLSYTIRINGITTASKNQNTGNTRWFLVNNCIPASGEQELEINIRPSMTSDGTSHKEFIENSNTFKIELESTSGISGSLEEPTIVYQYELPEGDYSRQETFVHKASFKAEVPYELIDWRNGKTFKDKDSTILKTAVLEFYKDLKDHYEHKNGEEYIKLIEKGMYNLAQGAYYDNDAFEKLKKNKIDFINRKSRELEDLDNYQLEISGNGKLLSLRKIDGYNREEGVLRRKYTKNGQETVHIDDIYLYAPQGIDSDNGKEKLEVIVYQNLVKPYFP